MTWQSFFDISTMAAQAPIVCLRCRPGHSGGLLRMDRLELVPH